MKLYKRLKIHFNLHALSQLISIQSEVVSLRSACSERSQLAASSSSLSLSYHRSSCLSLSLPTMAPSSSSTTAPTSKSNILALNFNQDASCVAVGTRQGYRIVNCEPFGKVFSKGEDQRRSDQPSTSWNRHFIYTDLGNSKHDCHLLVSFDQARFKD